MRSKQPRNSFRTAVKSYSLLWRTNLKRPNRVSALFPSSRFVGKTIAAMIFRPDHGHLLELGAGTGAVTSILLKNGVPPDRLTCIELDAAMGTYLKNRFPDVNVVRIPAQKVADYWKDHQKPLVSNVVSTLPIRLFDPNLQHRIINACLAVMTSAAPLIQLTYRLTSPIAPPVLSRSGLRGECFRLVVCNIPPAFIWRYQKSAG